MSAFSHHVSRFSFTNTDISELDIEWLLENNVPLSQLLPAAPAVDDYSPPPSPIDGAFDDLPELSPSGNPSSLPFFSSSPVPESPDTPRASRSTALARSPKSDVPLALAGYSFAPSSPSRSATPTPDPSDPLDTSFSLLPKFLQTPAHSKHASSILVELDEFFPRRPSDTFSPFPTFSSVTSRSPSIPDSTSDPNPPRKGSLASSLFSTTSSSESSRSSTSDDAASSTTRTRTRTRTRSRTVSNRSDSAAATAGGESEERQPKLAAYPRYVPPKVPSALKPEREGGGARKLKLFGR